MIMAALFMVIGWFLIPETYAPLLLQQRAKKQRFETKNWALHAEADETEINMKEIVQKYLFKPFQMLVMEPILVLMTLYMGFIYGTLFRPRR
jgi:DHA1 family multidrug resistance protein-like MFS transporter